MPSENIFGGYKGRIQTFSGEGKLKEYFQKIYPKGLTKAIMETERE